MCKLYAVHREAPSASRPAAGGAALRLEGAKMAELHYLEMGWSGSGWMDPLPSERPPSPSPASTPSSFDFAEPSPRRSETGGAPAAPRKKTTRRAARKAARKGRRTARKAGRAAKRSARKSARKGRRTARKSARSARRSARKSARSAKRSARKSARKGRRSSRRR
jgi:hypothetical protein